MLRSLSMEYEHYLECEVSQCEIASIIQKIVSLWKLWVKYLFSFHQVICYDYIISDNGTGMSSCLLLL